MLAGQRFDPDRYVGLRAAPTLGDRAQWEQFGRFGACHVHACPRPDRAALAMCALSPRVRACDETDLQPREGTDPSLIPTVVDIIIGKVRAKVSRSHTSNPSLLGPVPCPFSLFTAPILTGVPCGAFAGFSATARSCLVLLATDRPFYIPGASQVRAAPSPARTRPPLAVQMVSTHSSSALVAAMRSPAHRLSPSLLFSLHRYLRHDPGGNPAEISKPRCSLTSPRRR